MTPFLERPDEAIELREGDYVVAGIVPPSMLPRRAPIDLADVRALATIAFALGFLATAVLGLAVTLLS